MADYVVRATACGGYVRAFASTTRGIAEEMRKIHNTSPICTAAVGRLMSAAVMMAADMKGENDLLTLSISGDGPIRRVTVTADSHGHVKGYCANPNVMLPPNATGHLNVGGAVGKGILSVIRDIGLKEPYVGQTALISGEIADDITYYFAESEQTPSACGLGVLMNHDNTVREAGGYIVQLMPDAADELAVMLEERIKALPTVTDMMKAGDTPERILERIFKDMKLEINDRIEESFHCSCSRERVSRAIISIGKKELEKLAAENRPQEVRCDFCGKTYTFTADELRQFAAESKK